MDTFANVYDLRMLKPLVPVSVPSEPALIRFQPKNSNEMLILTRDGFLQTCGMNDQSGTLQFYQALAPEVEAVTMAVSSSGDCISFSDSLGFLHHWTNELDAKVNVMSRPVEIASPYVPPTQVVDAQTPLNVVGMPLYEQPLLSAEWPRRHIYTVSTQPPVIPTDVLARMKVIDGIGYAQYIRQGNTKRYQAVEHVELGRRGRSKSANGPKFRSEREREKIHRKATESAEQSPMETEGSWESGGFPSYYRRVEIRYSRFGIEDFDFGYYNRTWFAGLETHMTNSYCNSFLQLMYFTTALRKLVVGHMCLGCDAEPCLSCELAFLFRMLESAPGTNCQATNFLRALDSLPQVRALGLIEPDRPKLETPYATLIQNFSRFLLDRAHQECAPIKNDVFKTICGLETQVIRKCQQCECESKRTATSFSIDLLYPTKVRPWDGMMY